MARAADENGMSLEEQLEFMSRVVNELKSNRVTLQLLAVKAEAYDTITKVVKMSSWPSVMVSSESLENQIWNKVEELKTIKRDIETRRQDAANQKAVERALKKQAEGGELTPIEQMLIEASRNRDQT